MNTNNDTIAIFSFDRTITKKDTFFDFIKFCCGKSKLVGGLITLSQIIVGSKLKIVPKHVLKQEYIYNFFAQKNYSEFLEKCDLYKQQINAFVRPEALEKIKWHQSQGHRVMIISASVVDWILPWAKSAGIDEVYGTMLEVGEDNRITGRLANKNCYGQEKVDRFLEKYSNRSEYNLYVYGSNKGDKELLELADKSFYKKFN